MLRTLVYLDQPALPSIPRSFGRCQDLGHQRSREISLLQR